MTQALLMSGLVEAVVGRPAVVDHGAGVIEPQDVRSHVTAARRVDDVSRGLRADQRMQPSGEPAHPPAGLIGHNPVALTYALADGLVDRLAAGGGPQDGVDTAAA